MDSLLFSLIFFGPLNLQYSLLILLAILSIIGTLITQNATRSEYIQRYGIGLYEVLNFFNLFDMYHSWWFSAILLLLVINLVACSLHRFPGVWSQISREPTQLGWKTPCSRPFPMWRKSKFQVQAKRRQKSISDPI